MCVIFIVLQILRVGFGEEARQSQTSLQQVVPEDTGKFIESLVKIVLLKISYLPNHLLICENNTKFSDKQRMQKKHHILVLLKITLRCAAAR